MKITLEEAQLISVALQMRINYIETGHAVLSANDVIAMGKYDLVKNLSPSQRELILTLTKLRNRFTDDF